MTTEVCAVEECERPKFAKRWCAKHYSRVVRQGSPDVVTRTKTQDPTWQRLVFLSAGTDDPDACRIMRANGDYPSLKMADGSIQRASRLAFQLWNPCVDISRLEICHHCDNPRCINPRHLFAGTHLHNMRDMSRKGRAVGVRGVLSVADIPGIREDPRPNRAIANDFGCSESNIEHLKAGRTWASDIPPAVGLRPLELNVLGVEL